MGYVFLAGAIIAEVIATSFLKLTSGERVTWWAFPIVVVGYVAAFSMLSLALGRGVPLGTAYGIWAGMGVALVAGVSWLVFGETLTVGQLVGIALIIAGVALVELTGEHGAASGLSAPATLPNS
jgi:small multidrug resistance pump